MIQTILISLYFIAPAYFANMAPVVFAKLGWLGFLSSPIDGGRKMGDEYIFGTGKTWRGIVSAIIGSLFVVGIQALLFNNDYFRSISLLDYQRWFIIFGVCAGLGAILGDLVKSFIKRRIHISSGRPWVIFDQLDFIVGSLIFTWPIVHPPVSVIIIIVIITLIVHPLTNLISYGLGIKKVWW